MGERGLVLVQVDKNIKVAQYFHWGTYPEDNGIRVKDFVTYTMKQYKDIENIKNCFRNCKFISDEELEKRQDAEGAAFEEKYPQFSSEFYSILNYIVDEGGCELEDSEGFAWNSLFCEWAYLVNFDTEKVEFYKGFNREPLTEEDRFYEYMEDAVKYHEETNKDMHIDQKRLEQDEKYRAFLEDYMKPYYPIKMIFEIPFEELAKLSEWEFLDMFKPYEHED